MYSIFLNPDRPDLDGEHVPDKKTLVKKWDADPSLQYYISGSRIERAIEPIREEIANDALEVASREERLRIEKERESQEHSYDIGGWSM